MANQDGCWDPALRKRTYGGSGEATIYRYLPHDILGLSFLVNDSFVFANRVTKREPGMADAHNRGCSSQREFGFRSQGLALVEVCLTLLS